MTVDVIMTISDARTLKQLASSAELEWQRRNGIPTAHRGNAAADAANDVAGCGGNRPSSRWD